MKFGRTYRLTLQVSDTESIEVDYPLTIVFDVSRNTLASANRGRFQIYNLKPDTRLKIYHDRYDTLTYRRIVLQAGYEDESPLPTIFRGNIIQASSYRSGTNWITEIEAFDGGFGILNGQVSQTVPAGWTLPDIIKQVLGGLPNVTVGAVGDFSQQNARGITVMGSSWDVANRIATGQDAVAFVDNEQANLLHKDEYIAGAGSVALITSETGLLQTPRRYDARLDVEILFEPRLVVGQIVQLQSLEAVYNANYQVIGVQHRGTISGAVCDSATTIASLWLGTSQLRPVAKAA